MGGPSYQTPYPVDDTQGGKVIWSWDTKSWSPYTAPPATNPAPMPGAPDADAARGGTNAPDRSNSGTPEPTGVGSEQYQVPRGTKPRRRVAMRSGALPGASLLQDA